MRKTNFIMPGLVQLLSVYKRNSEISSKSHHRICPGNSTKWENFHGITFRTKYHSIVKFYLQVLVIFSHKLLAFRNTFK